MSPIELLKQAAEAFGKADHRPLLDALHEDVVWKSAASVNDGSFLFGGTYAGRASVVEHLSRISTAYFFQRFVTKEIISSGDVAWGLFDVEGSYRPLNAGQQPHRPLKFEVALRCRVRDGKIVELQVFFDTAALKAQQGQ